jgi:hypothetical protein
MKMIPPVVAETTDSAAERKLFPLLERTELGRNAVAMHSIDLPRHEYKRMGEIDFVVLAPAGLLVCEVKGGLVTRDDDGMWRFTDRYGQSNTKAEGPFNQARSAMFSLERELRDRLERRIVDQISFGYCVLAPDCEWKQDAVDAPHELIVDATEFAGARELSEPLARLLARFQETNGRGDMSAEALDRARNAIRGRFDPVPSLGTRARGIAAALQVLSEEQYAGLDWVENCDRLLVSGGAGTGKTLLALEMARRDALRGRSVLLTCQSSVLAAYLRPRAADGVEVVEFESAHGLVLDRGTPFDVVVIDEGQDVFSLEGVSALDALVAGGVDGGKWRCFYDLNNQAGLFGGFDPDAHELLAATDAHRHVLHRNCRNTKPIVLQTRTVTAADLGTPSAGDGPAVTFAKPDDRTEEAAMVTAELGRLTRADVPAGSITIVVGGSVETLLDELDPELRSRIVRIDASNVSRWPMNRITVVGIDDFKGLENDFVLVCGVTGIDESRRDRARIYVAMSRARVGLWMAIPRAMADRFEAIRRANVDKVLAGELEAW